MKAAFVDNGTVLNVIEVPALDFMPGLVAVGADCEPGGTYSGGVFSRRVIPQAEIAARALAELASIDIASIRAMREYIAAKPDAPQVLKDREAQAIAARAKLAGG